LPTDNPTKDPINEPTGGPTISPSLSNSPSSYPSMIPSSSWRPSFQPSMRPSHSSHPSFAHSESPSISSPPSKTPSHTPSLIPSISPSDSLTIRHQVFNPCIISNEGGIPLVGVTVTLYDETGNVIDQTVTDIEGYYTFTGLPMGEYETEVDYPECGRRKLHDHQSLPLQDEPPIHFFKNGDICDVNIIHEGWDAMSHDGFAHFDTVEECCANMFWYDMDGCFSRSHVAFQFDFCVDFSGFGSHSSCPVNEISAVESAMKEGLGDNSKLSLVEFGDMMLTFGAGGEIKCVIPTSNPDLISNQLRGVISLNEPKLSICGVVVTKETRCREETCLEDAFDKVVASFQGYFYNGVFSSVLRALSRDGLRPFLDLKEVEVVASSFKTKRPLLPSTASTFKATDGTTSTEYVVERVETPRFYPTYISGQLCHSKTMFDDWEESFETLKECCESFFSWDFEACCSSLNMGGC